jgi:16S rRNA processing protein RimM
MSDRENPDASLVMVGEIVAPFGVRGQMKMRALMDDPKALLKLPAVRLRFPNGNEEMQRITALQFHQGAALLTLDGVLDRNAAETLRGVQVYILREQLPKLEPDAYYDWQLVGLRVETDTGKDLGRIEKVHFYPANDVYETEVALIPAVDDEFILQVDLDAGVMRVRDVPGLRKDE